MILKCITNIAFGYDNCMKNTGKLTCCIRLEKQKKPREILDFKGDPIWIRTKGLRFRKPLLYPAELWGQLT